MSYSGVDCHIEDLMNTSHLLAAALDVCCTHLLCDTLALLRRYWRQTLRFEKIDACALGTEIGFEAD